MQPHESRELQNLRTKNQALQAKNQLLEAQLQEQSLLSDRLQTLVNEFQGRLRRYSNPWGLSQRECMILAMLLEYGRASRTVIKNLIWGDDEKGPPMNWTKSIHIHIHNIRKKLDDLNIEVVNEPWWGYKMSHADRAKLKPHLVYLEGDNTDADTSQD